MLFPGESRGPRGLALCPMGPQLSPGKIQSVPQAVYRLRQRDIELADIR